MVDALFHTDKHTAMKQMLFKFFFTMLLIAANSTTACGQAQQYLVVWQKSGEKVYFDLTERPRTTFEGSNLVITTTTLTVSYPLEQVLRYTYELPPSGINNVNLSKLVRISHRDNVLYLENLKPGTRIQLFTADGKMIATQQADGTQTITISLAQRPAGVYIVKANDVTYKMMKQ